MSQSDFARAIDRSLQMVRNYENGAKPPAAVIERLQTLAVEHGRADLGLALGDEWEVKHVIKPGETLITTARPAGSYNPKNKELHDMLELVLESGVKKAIEAVVPNLVLFADYVAQIRPTREIPSKRGIKPKREIG